MLRLKRTSKNTRYLHQVRVSGILKTMQTLTKTILQQGFPNSLLTSSQLERLLPGSPGSRYGLVNRALKAGELQQIQRGLYLLVEPYTTKTVHPFVIAQHILPGSYISFETALAYHGWIPEAVYTISSVTPHRKRKQVTHKTLGTFTFFPLALHVGYQLEFVSRIPLQGGTALVADPLRALMDLVCLRKVSWSGDDWLFEGLRIEKGYINAVSPDAFTILRKVYKHKRVIDFITALQRSLGHDQNS